MQRYARPPSTHKRHNCSAACDPLGLLTGVVGRFTSRWLRLGCMSTTCDRKMPKTEHRCRNTQLLLVFGLALPSAQRLTVVDARRSCLYSFLFSAWKEELSNRMLVAVIYRSAIHFTKIWVGDCQKMNIFFNKPASIETMLNSHHILWTTRSQCAAVVHSQQR